MVANKATILTASLFGIMAGLYGIEHGYFGTLQGNVAPSGVVISAVSPPCLPFPFECEPAMTILSNFFITRIAAIIVSMMVTIW